jgi:DNA polymerase
VPVIPIEDVLFYDAETRSALNLKKVGSWRYAEDPSTDVYMVCYAIGQGPVETWYPGTPVPQAILDHAAAGKYFSAHNVNFEYPLTNLLLAPRYGWPTLKIEQMHDTAAEAAAMGLPRSLEECGNRLGLDTQKDMEGHALMMRMCRPRKIIPSPDGGTEYTWWDDQKRIQQLAEYCALDVVVARQVFRKVIRLPKDERVVWELDQAINERGVRIDLELAGALADIVETAKKNLDVKMKSLTGGAVPKCTNAKALLGWLVAQGIDTESVAKPAVTRMLDSRKTPERAKEVLRLRRTAAKASTAKLKVMQQAACTDGRLRGMFRYHGAQTGRWSGALVMLQNLTRKSPPGSIDDAAKVAKAHGYVGVETLYGDPMGFASSMLRPCLIPEDDEELYTADLMQIEARMIAALAKEKRVLDVFASGQDIYCHAATGIFGRTITKQNSQERQVGKTSVLALGYGGGPVALSAMAKNYSLDLASTYDIVHAAADSSQIDRAYWGWNRYTGDMTERAFITADLIKQAWRVANPNIVKFWTDLEAAALRTVWTGVASAVGDCVLNLTRTKNRWYLTIMLPCGRRLCYHEPAITTVTTAWNTTRKMVVASTTDARTKKWIRRTLYGGLIAENATQASARDVLVEAMLRLDAAGYAIIAHVHDEVILTRRRGTGSVDQIRDLMTQRSDWMVKLGLPVGVDVSPPLTRYQK